MEQRPYSQLLRKKLILSFSLILIAGGLATSIIGSRMVSTTIFDQAQRNVVHDLAMARYVFDKRLGELEDFVTITASRRLTQECITEGQWEPLLEHLEGKISEYHVDFLSLTDASGRVIIRVRAPHGRGDDVSKIPPIRAALAGKIASSPEIMSAEELSTEGEGLADRAQVKIVPTPKARAREEELEREGMVLFSAAPVLDLSNRVIGALYGGVLLNRNYNLVDSVKRILYKGEEYQGVDIGTATIFLRDVRVSTNVMTKDGRRAIGTQVSREVNEAVLERGGRWTSRAFVVNDWYITAYEPIRNYSAQVIGILYVGLLEKPYRATRNNVVLAFFGVALAGFILIVLASNLITKSMMSPLQQMVNAMKRITAGDLNQEVRTEAKDELGYLASSFNTMLESIRIMKAELEGWAKTLEHKVKERTDELAEMQSKMAQAEKLASLGKLAAGVAHEINNPLGGILTCSSLVLEDLPEDDPGRPDLEEIVKQATRCRGIVKGLLEFARQAETKVSLINLNKVLEETLGILERQALFININTVRRLDPYLPHVLADPSQMQQVFMNVIVNAAEAMMEEGMLTLDSWASPDRNTVYVKISDTGCGIPEESINNIFDPFYTTKQTGRGTGLGLSVAYGIVERHGGRLWAESKVGDGTSFTISIPSKSREEHPDEESAEMRPAASETQEPAAEQG